MGVHSPSAHTQPSGGESGDACRTCGGAEWVCEDHQDRPWGGTSLDPLACHCGGAGAPCWICNREMALAGPLHIAHDHIKALLSDLDHGHGCACTFPSERCCAYSRAAAYLGAPANAAPGGDEAAKLRSAP